jgi:hypothetical protein
MDDITLIDKIKITVIYLCNNCKIESNSIKDFLHIDDGSFLCEKCYNIEQNKRKQFDIPLLRLML